MESDNCCTDCELEKFLSCESETLTSSKYWMLSFCAKANWHTKRIKPKKSFLKVIIPESFFPKIRYSLRKKAGLLACVLLFTFPFDFRILNSDFRINLKPEIYRLKLNSGFVDNNKLCSLQLREQHRIFDF